MVRLRPVNLCFIIKVIAPVELAAAQRELFFVACVSFIYVEGGPGDARCAAQVLP